MKPAIAILLLVVASAAFADEADIARGLENLKNVHAIALILDFRQGTGTKPDFDQPSLDPWGTPYQIDVERGRIVGAGSDRKFDELNWGASEQFEGLEGDVVFEGGRVFRSNRNWLHARVTPGKAAAELQALRSAEMTFMMMRTPEARQLAALQVSALAMQELSALAAKHGDLTKIASAADPAAQLVSESNGSPRILRDAWGTPLRLVVKDGHHRIISAGADRKFDPDTWGAPAATDAAEDTILEDGAFIRRVDPKALYQESFPVVEPVAQPVDPPPPSHTSSKWTRVGGDVKVPVVIERVEPVYPEDYRRMRLSGIVILECAITETGTVESIRIIKSVAPDFDMAAVDAVRGWKFRPGTRDGQPIPVLFNLTINFKLK